MSNSALIHTEAQRKRTHQDSQVRSSSCEAGPSKRVRHPTTTDRRVSVGRANRQPPTVSCACLASHCCATNTTIESLIAILAQCTSDCYGYKQHRSSSTTKPFTVNLYHDDLYCEHNGYDIMEMIQDQIAPKYQSVKPPFKCNVDDYAHSTHENLEDLKEIFDFEVEGEKNVVITNSTTDDPWLNKLVDKRTFIGQTNDPTANLGGRFIHEENDPEDDIVDPKFKAKKTICYPSFDPSTPWDQCKPVVGMKFENPLQLKNVLANYGVANGYQLWFMHLVPYEMVSNAESINFLFILVVALFMSFFVCMSAIVLVSIEWVNKLSF
ncbi:hypothetical protein Tco_0825837 [Tanacetum coccineum]